MRNRLLVFSLTATLAASVAAQTTQAPPPTQTGQAQGRGGGQGAGQQQPNRDAQAQATTGTGVIGGSVLTEGSGLAVRRARVTLTAPELRGSRTATTTDQGGFTFTGLPAGRYTLSASKPGYVNISYGARRAGRPGTPIQLLDGQKMEKALISLPKGAVVTGVVIDEHGEPSPGTQVRVMRAVMRTGEKTFEQAGQDQTDDRGIYRIYGLQPGDYIVNAMPRNSNLGDLQQSIRAEIETLMSQVQALQAAGGGRGGDAGGGGRAGRGGPPDAGMLGGRGGGRGQALLDQASALQQQLQQTEQQPTAYAPVFYPGTTAPSTATTVGLGVGEERGGIDFQLQLVPTARVEGAIITPDGVQPQNLQVTLVALGDGGAASIPGLGTNSTRVNGGRFQFSAVNPGQYRLTARAPIRATDPAAGQNPLTPNAVAAGRGGQAFGGRGGPGGPGQITQVLWASTDITVNGQNISDISLTLQPGMTIRGRVMFDGSNMPPPADLTRIRVNVSPRGQQPGVEFGVPAAQVDASGSFTITGIAPGKYSLNANVPADGGGRAGAAGAAGGGGRAGGAGSIGAAAPQWVIRSAATGAGDALDFGLVIEPNQDANVTLTFVDRNQEISGTIQDGAGKPVPDVTIILFPTDKRYWVAQARRIRSSRPGTDGKFNFSGLPPGQYNLTAVTDVEPGEWFNPDFLSQLMGASVTVSLGEAERKVQDLRVAGGF